MASLPLLHEEDLELVSIYSIDAEEKANEAVVSAFLSADFDVFDRSSRLADWDDADLLTDLDLSSENLLHVGMRCWDHLVIITPDEVRIYDPSTPE